MTPENLRESGSSLLTTLEVLQKLRNDVQDPAAFWPAYAEVLRDLSGAEAVAVAVRAKRDGTPWQPLTFVPPSLRTTSLSTALFSRLDKAAGALNGEPVVVLQEAEAPAVVAAELRAGSEEQTCLALAAFETPSRASEGAAWFKRLNDLPLHFQLSRTTREAQARQSQFADLVDLMMLLTAREKFLPAGMTLCNELATRHQCERVSLGWAKDGYIRLAAMSHVDDFDKKMEIVSRLELAMEEAFDQDADIVLPMEKEGPTVIRAHQGLRQMGEAASLCSLPLRVEGRTVGVCTFERNAVPFTSTELRLMRLALDQASRRLEDLKRRERWFWERWRETIKKHLVGTEWYTHTWAKSGAVVGAVLLAFLCFVPVTYRLESPVILKTEDVVYLTAPFDGHIEQVNVRVGDELKEGDELMRLDRNELMLEEAGLIAEKNRFAREAEKARAANALADMRIAQAEYDQSAARLEVVRHHLRQAVLTAPAPGIVVEGDQRERVGSPVEQGDVLFRLGRIDKMYAELEVPESEIHHVKVGQAGELSLASRPQDTHSFEVTRVEPAAVPKDDGNVFTVRARLVDGISPSWRPGMTGVGKIKAGRQTLLWIFTHRTMDFLRLKLWW